MRYDMECRACMERMERMERMVWLQGRQVRRTADARLGRRGGADTKYRREHKKERGTDTDCVRERNV